MAGATSDGRMVVEAMAPCRADLAGGTLDIWPLGILHRGTVTINVALPLMVRLQATRGAADNEIWHAVEEEPWQVLRSCDQGRDLTAAVGFALSPAGAVQVRVLSQAPRGSGLGGSSSYGVAMSSALLELEGLGMAQRQLVALVRDLEAQVMSAPTGVQDHWAAVRGGTSAVHIVPGGERVEALTVDADWIGQRLTVFFTGITHNSGMVNWQVIRRRLAGEAATVSALEQIAGAARSCRRALLAHDEAAVGEAVAEEWRARQGLAPEVCPSELKRLESAALGAGARAVKACGAGGGGSLLVWHTPEGRDDVIAALEAVAPTGRVLATAVCEHGCSVEVLER